MSYEARNDNYIRDVSQEVNEAIAFCSMQCHCGGGSQYNVTLRCFDGFHKNEDRNIEYKPTAEWQRIQTELQQGREAVEKLKSMEEGYEVMKERLLDSCDFASLRTKRFEGKTLADYSKGKRTSTC
jgi:hypothetical protein